MNSRITALVFFMIFVELLPAVRKPSAVAAISEQQASSLLQQFHKFFEPIVASHGARLFTELDFTATSAGAMATRSYDHKKWFIKVWGGIPKFPSATEDTYTLILCHEMGHHIGGYPFYSHSVDEWAATEGQADYWATQACAKKLWRDQIEINSTFQNVTDSGCEVLFTEGNEVNLCKRIYRAVDINAELEGKTSKGGMPSIKRRDASVAKELIVSHPMAQCRVDSMLMGLRCTREFNFNNIPGRGNPLGQNTISSENEARSSSCFVSDSFNTGVRPLCWFKPAYLDKAPEPMPKANSDFAEDRRLDLNDGLLPWIID